jgi:hypothetical protein
MKNRPPIRRWIERPAAGRNRALSAWLLCGAFYDRESDLAPQPRANYKLGRDFLAEAGGEAKIEPVPGLAHASPLGDGGQARWKIVSAEADGFVSYDRAFLVRRAPAGFVSTHHNIAGYGASYLAAEKPVEVSFELAVRPAAASRYEPLRAKVWLNQRLIADDLAPVSGKLKLKAGRNLLLVKANGDFRLRLRSASAIRAAFPLPPGASDLALRIEPTIFFPRAKNGYRQQFHAVITNYGRPQDGELFLRDGNRSSVFPLGEVRFGEDWYPFELPEVKRARAAAFELRLGGRVCRARGKLTAQKHWQVHLLQFSHTDVGFTDPQPEVAQIHDENLDRAIRFCELTKDWPEESRFRWVVESSWQLESYLRSRSPARIKELVKWIKRGQIEVAALYAGLLNGQSGHEELNRAVYWAGELRRRLGIAVTSALQVDILGCTWGLPQILARAGVKYFSLTPTNYRVDYYNRGGLVPSPFWWEGQDGSRVLVWFEDHYFSGVHYGFTRGPEAIYHFISERLSRWEANGCEGDAVLLQAALGDNSQASLRQAEVAREWNRRYAYPRAVISTPGRFFRYFERNFGEKLPVRKGDWGPVWGGHTHHAAYQTRLARFACNHGPSAEKLWSLARLLDPSAPYPAEELKQMYDFMLLHDEHSGGVYGPLIPEEEEGGVTVQEAVLRKLSYAFQAKERAADLTDQALGRIASQVKTGENPTLLAFNPLCWPRSDVVHLELPNLLANRGLLIRDAGTGRAVPHQVRKDKKTGACYLTFVAERVPSLGYRLFEVEEVARDRPAASDLSITPARVENRFYRVEVNPATGAIKSLYDKTRKRELVNLRRPYPFGRLAFSGDREEIKVETEIRGAGPAMARLRLKLEAENQPHVMTEVRLYRNLPRVDVGLTLDKERRPTRPGDWQRWASLACHFPLAVSRPSARVEVANGSLDPASDQLPGIAECKDWFTIGHWAAVSGKEGAALIAPRESSMLSFADDYATLVFRPVGAGWSHELAGARLQDFWYALQAARAFSEPAAVCFGWEFSNPLLCRVLLPRQPGPLANPLASFLEVESRSAICTALKRAEDGEGYVLRLLETSGRAAPAAIRFPGFRLKGAWRASLTEERGERLSLGEDELRLRLGAREVATIRVRLR